MNNKPIGVFDSGLGGLTAVSELISAMPDESIVYFGDTGRVPYGNKSEETIIKYTFNDINFLLTHDVKLIIIACGTASSIALDEVKDKYDIPIIGVVDTAAKAAICATKNKKIGIIGTQGTIKTGAYSKTIKGICDDIMTVSSACPLFVPLVENGYTEHEITYIIAREYLAPLIEAGVDTVILGCTHYPHLKKVISDIMGREVTLIDSGYEVANYARKLLGEIGLCSDDNQVSYKYFVSDSVEDFTALGSRFLNRDLGSDVYRIDIEKY